MSKIIEIERGIFTFMPSLIHELKSLSEVHRLYVVFYERVGFLHIRFILEIAKYYRVSKLNIRQSAIYLFLAGALCSDIHSE